MKSLLSNVRLLIMLRRVWKALERGNDIAQARLDFDMEQAGLGPKKVPKKTQISVATVEDFEKNWIEKHPEV